MADMTVSITLEALDNASEAIAKVREAMGTLGTQTEDTGKKTDETKSAFERIQEGFERGFGLTAGYTGFHDLEEMISTTIDTVVGFNAELETMGMRLENLTGSVGGAADAIQGIKDLADASPFEFKDIETGEERLLRFNFSIDDAGRLLKVAADAAAGGAGTVDTITQAFGRLNEKTDLSTRGLMGLQQAGIPVFDDLAKGLGVTTAEAEKLVTKGLIPTKEGIDILAAAIEQQFPDMAAKVSTGFDATIKNLKETIAFAAADMGKPLFDALESAAQDALIWLKSPDVVGALDEFGKNVASTVKDVIDWFKQLGSAMSQKDVQDNLREAWDNIRIVGQDLWGLVKAMFIPTQNDLNTSLGSGATPANEFAADVKILSAEMRDLSAAAKDVFGPLQTINDALNTDQKAAHDLGVAFHNDLIGALQDVLSPLTMLLDALDKLELIANKVFHIQIDIPGQAGMQAFLDSIHTIQTGPGATTGGGAATPNLSGFPGSAASLRPSQFSDPQLSADEALAACGPAALVAFMRTSGGKVPTLREAATMSMTPAVGGWNAQQGMVAGVAGEQNLLGAYGLSSNLNTAPTEAQIQAGADTGSGEIIDTLNHFFTATGYDTATGQYNVGTSGTDLKGGSAQMTLDQMTALEGQVTGILTDIHGLTTAVAASAGDVTSQKTGGVDAFKSSFQPYADYAASALGISSSDVTAMAINESGGGNIPGNSFFGMKASPEDIQAGNFTHQATWENKDGQRVDQGADFKTYTTPQASVDDFIQYVKQNDPQAVGAQTPEALAQGLKAGGYMTDTAAHYASSLRDQGAIASSIAPGPGEPGFVGPIQAPPAAADLAAAAAEPFTKKFDTLIEQTTAGMAAIQTREDKALASATTQYGPGGTADKAAQATADKALGTPGVEGTLDKNKAIQDDIAARKNALAQQIQDDTTANAEKVAGIALVHSRQLADDATVHSRQIEDANIVVQQQVANVALVHSRDLADAQTVHAEVLKNAATEHSEQMADAATLVAQQDANTQLVHQRTLQNTAIQLQTQLTAAATLHQRQLQDAQVAPNEALQDTATGHSRQLQDTEIVYQQGISNAKAQHDYQEQLNAATSDAQRKSLQDAHAIALEDQAETARAAQVELAHQRQLQDAEAVYQQGVQAAAVAAQRKAADEESVYQQGLAATALTSTRALQDTEIAYQNNQKAQQTAAQRVVAAAESQYQMGLAKTETDYQRGLQDQEVTYQEGVAAQALSRNRAAQDTETAYQRTLQDKEVAYQLTVQAAARAFTAQEKAKTDALNKTLADEAFARQKQQVLDDLAAKKAAIAEEFATRTAAAVAQAATERATFKTAQDQKAKDQIQAAQDALKGFLGAGDPIVAAMQAKWDAMDATLATAAQDITGAAAVIQTATDATAAKEAAAAVAAQGDAALVVAAVQTTVDAYQQSDEDISKSLGISDLAVETYADHTHQHWDTARTDLNNAVQNYGVGSKQISDAFGITDKTIEQFALDHHEDWDKARTDLNAAAINMTTVLGDKGTIPTAAGQTSTAIGGIPTAIQASKTPLQQLQDAAATLTKQGLDPATQAAKDLNTAIQEIKDKTVTVRTVYDGGNGGAGGGGYQGAANPNIFGSAPGGLAPASGGSGPSSNSAPSSDPHASPFGSSTIGSSGPGGRYNDPSTGQPYTHAEGGVTTGPIFGTDSSGGQHVAGEAGPEAIIPLGEYFVSHKADHAGPSVMRLHPDDIAAIADALAQRIPTTIGVDVVHGALLRKAKVVGRLGLS